MSHYDYGCVQEVICNENNVYPAMKDLVEVHNMSVKGAARFVHEDSGGKVTEERARNVYRYRKGLKTDGHVTNPEAGQMAEAIVRGEVTDGEMKMVVDAVAEKVKTGKASPRTVASAAGAYSQIKEPGKRKEVFEKNRTKVERMVNNFHRGMNLLDEITGQGPEALGPKDRDTMDQEFRFMVPRLLRLLDHVGLDIRSIIKNIKHRFITGGDQNEKNNKDHTRPSIET